MISPDASGGDGAADTRGQPLAALRINELCADDDGFQIDELGHTEDWIELHNAASAPIDLFGFRLERNEDAAATLPHLIVPPGGSVLLWADSSPEEGARHLSFRLPAGGGEIRLRDPNGVLVDQVVYPAAAVNEAYARFPDSSGGFARCRYASPGRVNGSHCGPAPRPDPAPEVTFAPYVWPVDWGKPAGPLVISAFALAPQGFVEVTNTSDREVALDSFLLHLAPSAPDLAWSDGIASGVTAAWPSGAGFLSAGARAVVRLSPEALAVFAGPEQEGVVSLVRESDRAVIHRQDFMRVPSGAAWRMGAHDPGGPGRLCVADGPQALDVDCRPLASREIGDRLRHLRTPGDFAALAAGGTRVSDRVVKFVIDMQAGDTVFFLGARRWPLHYTFIRERIHGQPPLDRCDSTEAAVFQAGWQAFSDQEYFQLEGRRFLLGSLVRHEDSTTGTVEFDRADQISGPLMRRAFFAVAAHLPDRQRWSVRAQGGRQVPILKAIEGTLPVVDENAPFLGVSLQTLNPGVAYGWLRFVPADGLTNAAVGPDTIVVTDDIPLDVPLVGGIITEVFQTSLSHVAVLARGRGIPDMAVRGARLDPRLEPWFDRLVRLEVQAGGFEIREAESAEAEAFWASKRPSGEPVAPRLATTLRGVVPLRGRGLEDLPALGAKAAQLAELYRVVSAEPRCLGAIPAPPVAFAVPVVHEREHFARSGAQALLASWRERPGFATDPGVRKAALAEIRTAILAHPVDPALLLSLEAAAREAFGTRRFRLRSSSNAEDLSAFNGAGLYTSLSAAIGDPQRDMEDGLRQVWSSLWEARAYEERGWANIDQSRVAMGVLIHEAYPDVERANGVVVSRDIRDPIDGQIVSLTAQAGEASVTNPAPGVTSEELSYAWWRSPPVVTHARSSLTPGPVVELPEIEALACTVRAIEAHFRERLDPTYQNRWFAMEAEWKLVGPQRRLVVKQARPYSFGSVTIPADCREK